MAFGSICHDIVGLEPGPETEALTHDYGVLLAGLAAPVPLRVPGTTYGRAMAARDRLLARIRTMVGERRARPRSDGLSRILTCTAPEGSTYTDDEAVVETHHIVVAGFLVYSLMAEVVRRLAEQPDLRRRCAEEIGDRAPSGPLTLEVLEGLITPRNVVLETKRFVPLVPLAFGRALRSFTCAGFEVPNGWTVWLALYLNNRDPAIFADPLRFDPDRFGPGRAEHERHP